MSHPALLPQGRHHLEHLCDRAEQTWSLLRVRLQESEVPQVRPDVVVCGRPRSGTTALQVALLGMGLVTPRASDLWAGPERLAGDRLGAERRVRAEALWRAARAPRLRSVRAAWPEARIVVIRRQDGLETSLIRLLHAVREPFANLQSIAEDAAAMAALPDD